MSIWATRIYPSAAFYLAPMRAWELLLGALLVAPAFTGWLAQPSTTQR